MLLPLFVAVSAALAGTSVSGGSGSAARLQDALDACPVVGCEIELPDSLYAMEHQLWIHGKEGVRLRSTGSRPAVLRWEDSLLAPDGTGAAKLFRMTPPVGGSRPNLAAGWLRWPTASKGGAGTLGDSTNPWASNGFQHNGLVLVLSSRSVRLEGLVLDGIRPAAFVNRYVWDGMYDLVHGSVGLCAFQSRGVEFVDGEIRNFWAGVYWNDRNVACAAWEGGAFDRPWQECGAMGGHLVEANRIHGNKFGIFSEGAWDLGSVVRDNLAWDNYDRAQRGTGASTTPKEVLSSSENISRGGGLLYVRDVVFPAHVVTRNTTIDTGEARAYGWGSHRAAANALWSDNLLEMRAGSVAGSPLSSYLHLFSNAAAPHLWNTGVLANVGNSVGMSSAVIVDSTIRWTAKVAVPRDTLDGKLAGGKVVGMPGDSVDTVIAGTPVRLARVKWVTIFYDTVSRDTSCAKGCWMPATATIWGVEPGLGSFWNIAYLAGDSVTASFKAPDMSTVVRTAWFSMLADSTAPFRLRNMDTVGVWERNLVGSANAGFVSSDPLRPGFLGLDTSRPGTRRLLAFGSPRARVGALAADGSLRQEPIRLRARGHGRWDKAAGELVLPIGISGRLAGVERLVVRRAWIAARPIDPLKVASNTPAMAERRKMPLSLPVVSPTDTVVRIPFADVGSDSLFQVDLWLAGIAGSDTIEATPMAWSIATPMGSSLVASVSRERSLSRIWDVRGRSLRIEGGAASTLAFVNARGSRRVLPVRDRGAWSECDLSALPAGVWIPHLPGARPVVVSPALR